MKFSRGYDLSNFYGPRRYIVGFGLWRGNGPGAMGRVRVNPI